MNATPQRLVVIEADQSGLTRGASFDPAARDAVAKALAGTTATIFLVDTPKLDQIDADFPQGKLAATGKPTLAPIKKATYDRLVAVSTASKYGRAIDQLLYERLTTQEARERLHDEGIASLAKLAALTMPKRPRATAPPAVAAPRAARTALGGKAGAGGSVSEGSGSSEPGGEEPADEQGDFPPDRDEPNGHPDEDSDGSPADGLVRVRRQIECTDDDFDVPVEFVCPEPIRDAFIGRSRGRFLVDLEHIEGSTITLRVTAAAVID